MAAQELRRFEGEGKRAGSWGCLILVQALSCWAAWLEETSPWPDVASHTAPHSANRVSLPRCAQRPRTFTLHAPCSVSLVHTHLLSDEQAFRGALKRVLPRAFVQYIVPRSTGSPPRVRQHKSTPSLPLLHLNARLLAGSCSPTHVPCATKCGAARSPRLPRGEHETAHCTLADTR